MINNDNKIYQRCRTKKVFNNQLCTRVPIKSKSKSISQNINAYLCANAYESDAGRKELYRCNLVPRRGPQCAKAVQLLFDSESLQVLMYIDKNEHTHDAIFAGAAKKSQRINEETIAAINRMITDKLLPKTIRCNLASEAKNNPRITVLLSPTTWLQACLARISGPSHWNKRHG